MRMASGPVLMLRAALHVEFVNMKKCWNKWHSLQDKRAFYLLLFLVLSRLTSLAAELTSSATSDWI